MRIARGQLFLFLVFFIISSIYDRMKCKCSGYNCNSVVSSHKNHRRLFPGWYPDFVDAIVDDSIKDKRANGKGSDPKITATSIAQKAAKEAVAASEAQSTAGQAASHQVRAQLAEKAAQAAKAAEAALAGKQQIVEELSQEVAEAQGTLDEATNSLRSSQNGAESSQRVVEQIRRQIKILTEVVQLAQTNAANADQAANGAQAELAEKVQLLEAAKQRIAILLGNLAKARDDLKRTKQAAYKAACAAQKAKFNVQKSRRGNVHKHHTPPLDGDTKSNIDNLNHYHSQLGQLSDYW